MRTAHLFCFLLPLAGVPFLCGGGGLGGALRSQKARTCILNAIQRERAAEEQDRNLLKESVDVFVEMGYNFGDKKIKVYQGMLCAAPPLMVGAGG